MFNAHSEEIIALSLPLYVPTFITNGLSLETTLYKSRESAPLSIIAHYMHTKTQR